MQGRWSPWAFGRLLHYGMQNFWQTNTLWCQSIIPSFWELSPLQKNGIWKKKCFATLLWKKLQANLKLSVFYHRFRLCSDCNSFRHLRQMYRSSSCILYIFTVTLDNWSQTMICWFYFTISRSYIHCKKFCLQKHFLRYNHYSAHYGNTCIYKEKHDFKSLFMFGRRSMSKKAS